MRFRILAALLLGLGFYSSAASACPLCHTSTANEVRAGLSKTGKDSSVYMGMLLPFAAIGVAIGFMNRFGFNVDQDENKGKADEK